MVPLMHFDIHPSHYSYVCYIAAFAVTAVAKSCFLGRRLGMPSLLWSPMATTGYAVSYWLTSLNAIPMDFQLSNLSMIIDLQFSCFFCFKTPISAGYIPSGPSKTLSSSLS